MTTDAPALEFATDDTATGFRLHRLELLNWGTFNQFVWTLNLHGQNTLLTGDIGSGKSTVVDAVTTLLVPAHRVAYNKAAGAEGKERSLRSYVLGHYKSERNDVGGSSKPVALRDDSTLSVILGVFRNEGFDQTITLAQVFWMREAVGQPARLFVGAEHDLTIAEHFTSFGADIPALRKRLKAQGAELNDTFPPYEAWFRRRLGIQSSQALDLFHQTVSMKSVGNLTEFVRQHMLDAGSASERIEKLLGHFDDLNRAHESVLRAKRQMEMLQPLVADCDRHDLLVGERNLREACRNALRTYFADVRSRLVRDRLDDLASQRQRLETRQATHDAERRDLLTRRESLRSDLAANGGDRLAAIDAEIAQLEAERSRRKQKADKYASLCRDLDLAVPEDADAFHATRNSVEERRAAVLQRGADVQNDINEAGVQLQQGKHEHDALGRELESLRSRKSNIPHEQVALRERLCAALGIDEQEVPFAGELLQVRDGERAWLGSAERVMRSFGLALLVADDRYTEVQAWVDSTNLRHRFVYFRVRDDARGAPVDLQPQWLASKIEVQPGTRWRRWLHGELARRFDYICCDTPEQFRRERRALTLAGQTKGGDERHEKDDRLHINDRSRDVLGWSNADKIAAIEDQQRELAARLGPIAENIAALGREQGALQSAAERWAQLSVYDDYVDLDWRTPVRQVEERKDERERLSAASDQLRQLRQELDDNESTILALDETLAQLRGELAKIDAQAELLEADFAAQRELLAAQDAMHHLVSSPAIDVLRGELGLSPSTLRSCEGDERRLREHLQAEIDALGLRLARGAEKIVKAMQAYRHDYPAETTDVDASVDAADAYRAMLHQLVTDDLPSHEARFKQLLNENTINEIANFQAQLLRQRSEISERIEAINGSLTHIDYNPGRYIALELSASGDPEVRDFQQDLRKCTEDSLMGSDDPHYAERKFLEVRALIDRFRGRDGVAEIDRRWTAKVTDVRNWFVFAASERYREDDSEHEHYSDSSGKSGGQKEKLAYTVLAASLAYQFGLEWGEVRSKSFRFVVIDEAFGRGSDESARYGLQLFARLNLQLLVVTPLQKIHVIEPFVRGVGFVHNDGGRDSRLRNLTIEQYLGEKGRRRSTQSGGESQ